MNLALSDEQEFLREAARGALSRVKTIEAARGALEGGELPDLWPTAVEAGWPGLLVDEDRGGAGLGAFDAMLVLQECGRVLASVALLGHVVATAILNAAGFEALGAYAAGERRAVYVGGPPPPPPPPPRGGGGPPPPPPPPPPPAHPETSTATGRWTPAPEPPACPPLEPKSREIMYA